MTTMNLSRRGFLKGAAASAAVLVVGLNAKGTLAAGDEGTVLNPFVRIDKDGGITVIIKHFEMGQGTTTGLTTLVAEELDADWTRVKTEFAPADNAKYANLFMGVQLTGGSTAIANSFMQYREAGATARTLLVRAAAQKWGVPESQITIADGVLSAGNKQGHFGEFVGVASTLSPPEKATVKSPDDFKLIGKIKLPRKDNDAKTDGSAIFAMDVKLPGMVYAAILRSPKFGGVLSNFDASEAAKVAGFIDAKALPNKAGVAVYAKNTWAAFQARDAITADWDFSAAETRSTAQLVEDHRTLAETPQFSASPVTSEQAQSQINAADKVIEAEFTFPFLSHAPMEPLNCVIEPTANGVRFHDGCQAPTLVQGAIAHLLGLQPQQVEINTVYAGGSFGRRATITVDYQTEAALAFDLLGRKVPVKLVWSREDDIRGGYYRAMALHRAKIGLGQDGKILGWDHRLVTKSIIKGSPWEENFVHNGVDHTSVEGVAGTLYQVPNMAIGLSDFQTAVPTLWWRSVGNTHTAYAVESLLDMVAHETGQDPIELRLDLLDKTDPKQARMAGVIEAARDLARWQKGQKRGFAAHFSFNTYVATVADVTVKDDTVHVDKIYIAVDCGVAVNPDVIKAQMEGGTGYGLGAILRNEITLESGEVVQANFPDYEPLRITDMPDIKVAIVASGEAPSGVGEPAVPPTGPAVANAIFAATGKRLTELPLSKSGLTFV